MENQKTLKPQKTKINVMSGQSMPLLSTDRRITVTTSDGGAGTGNRVTHNDAPQLIELRRTFGNDAVLTRLLGGRESMQVAIRDLDDVDLKLLRLAGDVEKRLESTNDEKYRMQLHEIDNMRSYLEGIIHARLALHAVGLEVAAWQPD